MSRIYFSSPSSDAELRGSERAHMGIMIDSVWAALITPYFDSEHNPSSLRKIVRNPPPIAPARPRQRGDFDEPFWWQPSQLFGEKFFDLPNGESVDFFSAALNTAMQLGDVLRVFAFLHGGCEIHAYVEGPDRAWLADIIDKGRSQGIMRADMGWESVATMLRERDDEPVVTSYSVTESFPGPHLDPRYRGGDRWYEKTDEKKWEIGMKALRAGKFGPQMCSALNWFGLQTTQPWHAFNLIAVADSLDKDDIIGP